MKIKKNRIIKNLYEKLDYIEELTKFFKTKTIYEALPTNSQVF